MKATDKARIILYRCHEKGVEVLLIRPDLKEDSGIWRFPTTDVKHLDMSQSIRLNDEVREGEDSLVTMAVEADWHHIPSIRGIVKHDFIRLGSKIKKVSNQLQYHNVKDALKEVLPNEYKVLKELKDILLDKNQASYI